MVGTTISHYKVIEKIGQGGMGEVYRATDTNLSRDVAIKVLPEQFTKDPQRLARFEREAKLLASLNHPNIAAIYGFEEADDVRFLAMELVEGETLQERVAKGPVPVKEALEVCRQIAQGVEAAHEKGAGEELDSVHARHTHVRHDDCKRALRVHHVQARRPAFGDLEVEMLAQVPTVTPEDLGIVIDAQNPRTHQVTPSGIAASQACVHVSSRPDNRNRSKAE